MNSKQLKAAREACALSQYELAEIAGVSRSTIAFAERGLELSETTLGKVTAALSAALVSQTKAVAKAKRSVSKAAANTAVEVPTVA